MGRIVVGIDGSWVTRSVLHFALEEAKLRGWSLHVVHAWRPSTGGLHTYYAGGLGTRLGGVPEARAAVEQQRLERLVGKLTVHAEGVEITEFAVEGDPVRVLLEAAKDADLLVVGSRGGGGFAGLLLGSVSQQCAHHAPCPVVIVPPPAELHRLMWPEV